MGVRPPADDGLEEPDVVEFGIAALDARLDQVSYPIDVATLEARYGDLKVPYDATGNTVTLASVLERVDRREFDSERDLKNALHPVFEEIRESKSTSLLAQLRALVPF
jgi:hypothetical protein